MIRLCDASDIEDILQLAIQCYPSFEVSDVREWFEKNIGNPDVFLIKGVNCCALCFISRPFYSAKSPTFELEFICGLDGRFGAPEIIKLISYCNDLRKEKGYDKMWINSRLTDLYPLVKRLGGRVGGQSWILED